MRKKMQEEIQIPEGVVCEIKENNLNCKKDSLETTRNIGIPKVEAKVKDNKIVFQTDKGSKREHKLIKTFIAHINNIFNGLADPHTYQLEAVNVHFPMTLKLDGDILTINNFLGEKVPRTAKVVKGANVEVKANKITITSHDKEAAGQTAGNIENATRVKGRDRRIFQDGIFITDKPRREI